MLQSMSNWIKTKCLCVISGLVASCSQMTFCHTRSETRSIASETTSRATRTCQHFSDLLLTICFASFWVTREWLFAFGNTASRASLTWGMLQTGLDEGMLQSGLDECSTWSCSFTAWTSAYSGIGKWTFVFFVPRIDLIANLIAMAARTRRAARACY